MSKIFNHLLNILFIFIIFLLIVYFILRATNKIEIYNVETGSMENKIHPGDYILLLKKDKYYVGDIITFKVKKYFVTHRIIKIEDDKIITKGDANNEEDDAIHKNQIEGKVIYYGGILNFIIKFKFVIVVFLIGLYLLSSYFGEDKTRKQKNEKSNLDEG